MKLPQFDFSKDGLNKFFLHHTEKLILIVAIIGTGLFFYLGFSTEVYDKTTPKQLSSMTDSAESYMLSNTSWDNIKDHRQGDDRATQRLIDGANRYTSSAEYSDGPLNIRARSLEKRLDPELYTVENLQAQPFTALMLRKWKTRNNTKIALPISSLSAAGASRMVDDENDGRNSGMGGLGDDDFGDDDDKKKKRRQEDDTIVLGVKLPAYLRQLMTGVIPAKSPVNDQTHQSDLQNMVMVTGLVDVEKQWKAFEKALKGRQGYWPKRDRPIYQLVEIQRMEQQPNGEWGEWEDKTDLILRRQPSVYPRQLTPEQNFGAPEVIDPENYDPRLTHPIPPITMMDYRKELFMSPEFQKLGLGLRDLTPAAPKEKVEFVKATDPNSDGSEFEEFGDTPKEKPVDEASDGSAKVDPTQMNDKKGTNFAQYFMVGKSTRKPKAKYKLLRFFDMTVKPNYSYRYRVRLWIADPNNEDPKGIDNATENKDDRLDGLKGGVGGGGGGLDDGGGGGGDSGKDEDDEDNSKRVAVRSTMLSQTVRVRLATKKDDELPTWSNEKDEKYKHSRVTNPKWENAPTVEVKVIPTKARFYAGGVRSGRLLRVGDNLIPDGEPVAELVTSELSEKYDTNVPAHRLVHRADVLNFEADAHLLHPVNWNRVLKAEKHEFNTDAVVVDMMGGSELKEISGTSSRSRATMKYAVPSEILIMDFETGKFRVQNDTEDRKGYRLSLLLSDEVAEQGKIKKSKPKDDEPGGGDDDF